MDKKIIHRLKDVIFNNAQRFLKEVRVKAINVIVRVKMNRKFTCKYEFRVTRRTFQFKLNSRTDNVLMIKK